MHIIWCRTLCWPEPPYPNSAGRQKPLLRSGGGLARATGVSHGGIELTAPLREMTLPVW
jgi:hypothetical protein